MKWIKTMIFFTTTLLLFFLCFWANTGFAVDICSKNEIEQFLNFEGTAAEFVAEFPKTSYEQRIQSDSTVYIITCRSWNTEYCKTSQNDEQLNLQRTQTFQMSRNTIDFFALNIDNLTELKSFDKSDFYPFTALSSTAVGDFINIPISKLICTKDGYDVYFKSKFDLDYYGKYYSTTKELKWKSPTFEIVSYDGKSWNITSTYGGNDN